MGTQVGLKNVPKIDFTTIIVLIFITRVRLYYHGVYIPTLIEHFASQAWESA